MSWSYNRENKLETKQIFLSVLEWIFPFNTPQSLHHRAIHHFPHSVFGKCLLNTRLNFIHYLSLTSEEGFHPGFRLHFMWAFKWLISHHKRNPFWSSKKSDSNTEWTSASMSKHKFGDCRISWWAEQCDCKQTVRLIRIKPLKSESGLFKLRNKKKEYMDLP